MSTAGGVAVPRWRTDAVNRLRRVRWRGPLVAAFLGIVIALLTVERVSSLTGLFLTPDGGHYLADADAVLGDGARELRHPPLFPVLLAIVRAFAGELDGFLWTMALLVPILLWAHFVDNLRFVTL